MHLNGGGGGHFWKLFWKVLFGTCEMSEGFIFVFSFQYNHRRLSGMGCCLNIFTTSARKFDPNKTLIINLSLIFSHNRKDVNILQNICNFGFRTYSFMFKSCHIPKEMEKKDQIILILAHTSLLVRTGTAVIH